MSASSASRCELTETYSLPPWTSHPRQAPPHRRRRMASFEPAAAATPIIKLEVETMPSSEPSTAARSQPARSLLCCSGSFFVCRSMDAAAPTEGWEIATRTLTDWGALGRAEDGNETPPSHCRGSEWLRV